MPLGGSAPATLDTSDDVTPILQILGRWIRDPVNAELRPVPRAGFSGARLCQVRYRERTFALRRWSSKVQAERLIGIHGLQRFLVACGFPVPNPVGTSTTGETFVRIDGALWELAPWMPGTADYWTDPQPAKLTAALRSLAQVHLAMARLPIDFPTWMKPTGISPGLMRRSERLCNLQLTGLAKLENVVRRLDSNGEEQYAKEAELLVRETALEEFQKSARWESEPLPLQMCLRDMWHDHVLFTGEQVTGIVDFGAVGFDSPAGDVARLLGSLVGDDRGMWQAGLTAYESVRPLSGIEREAADFFDSSGTVISTVNWVNWLFGKTAEQSFSINREAALKRLGRLIERLRVLAGR